MTTLIGLLIVTLIILIFFQVSKASEFVGIIKGKKESEEKLNDLNAILFMAFLIIGLFGIVWSAIYYAPWYLKEPASEHGVWIRQMFQYTLVPTGIVFVITHIMLFWFCYRYRHKDDRIAVHFADSHKLELIWTLVPAVVMVVLVTIGLVNWFKIFGPVPDDALLLEATGKQFQWDLRYAGDDNKLGAKSVYDIGPENPFGMDWKDRSSKDDFKTDTLYLEINRPVQVKINSIDVLHSFYLPHFRVKMDAVPGIPTQFWFTPTKTTKEVREEYNDRKFDFELACAELCGQAHFNMRRVVKVVEKDEFDRWFKRQKSLYATLGVEEKMKDAEKASIDSEDNDSEATKTASAL